jgi:hypothetical protein
MLGFRQELFSAGGRQFVVAGFAIVLGNIPLGLDPAPGFEAIERRIK